MAGGGATLSLAWGTEAQREGEPTPTCPGDGDPAQEGGRRPKKKKKKLGG